MIVFIIIYLIIQLLVGFWLSSKIKNESDYFVAGKNLGTPILMFSLFATWFGAETCIGTSGAVYDFGLSGSRADPFGYSLCLFLSGLLLAKRIWNKSFVTLADFYKLRYGFQVEKLAALVIIPSSILWAAAQIRAFGQVISSVSDFPVFWAITFAASFVTIYTFFGGLLGDIYTDFIQGIILIAGLLILCIFTLNSIPNLADVLVQMDAQRFSFISPTESWLERIDRWAIPILGSLVAQELVARLLAAKNVKIAVKASYTSALLYLSVGLIPVFIGLVGPVLMPEVADSEQFLMLLAKKLLPNIFYIIFIGALISAILATIDSTLLASSALFSHNIVIPLMKIKSERSKLFMGRLFVVVSAILAYVLALFSESIYSLVEEASGFGSSGILIITFMGLWTKVGGQWAAMITVIIGIIAPFIFDKWLSFEGPYILSIGLSFLTYLVISLMEKNYFNSNLKSPPP